MNPTPIIPRFWFCVKQIPKFFRIFEFVYSPPVRSTGGTSNKTILKFLRCPPFVRESPGILKCCKMIHVLQNQAPRVSFCDNRKRLTRRDSIVPSNKFSKNISKNAGNSQCFSDFTKFFVFDKKLAHFLLLKYYMPSERRNFSTELGCFCRKRRNTLFLEECFLGQMFIQNRLPRILLFNQYL